MGKSCVRFKKVEDIVTFRTTRGPLSLPEYLEQSGGKLYFVANNGSEGGLWSYDYEGISRANLAISYLTDDDVIAKVGLAPALRDRLLGEAYFLRAFYYFDLVNAFGGVPMSVAMPPVVAP